MLPGILSGCETYNETVSCPFARLAEVLGGRRFARELGRARETSTNGTCFSLIEVRLQRGDVSPILRGS
jgi:hypothetical protein